MAEPLFHNINGKRVQMTAEEEAATRAEWAANDVIAAEERAAHDKKMAKKADFEKKGWTDAMAILEDMADRGVDAVLGELKTEKDKHK